MSDIHSEDLWNLPLPVPSPSGQMDSSTVAFSSAHPRVSFVPTVSPAPSFTKMPKCMMASTRIMPCLSAPMASEATKNTEAGTGKKERELDGTSVPLWGRRGAEQPHLLDAHLQEGKGIESKERSTPKSRPQQKEEKNSPASTDVNRRGSVLYKASESVFCPWGSAGAFWSGVVQPTSRPRKSSFSGVTTEVSEDVTKGADDKPLGGWHNSGDDTTSLLVRVLGMSPLHADSSVVYPFVRVWLVNGTTGENLIQVSSMPMSCAFTHPVDLRSRCTRAPWWDAELTLPVQSRVVDDASLNALLLLEVVEGGVETIQGFPVRRNGLYPVCWGFVKLHEADGRMNLRGRLHVQMFPFPQRSSCFTRLLQLLPSRFFPTAKSAKSQPVNILPASPSGIQDDGLSVIDGNTEFPTSCRPPDLFFVFREVKNRKVPYSAGMLISLKRVEGANYIPRMTTLLPHEEHMLQQMPAAVGLRPRSSVATSFSVTNTQQMRSNSVGLMNAMALRGVYVRGMGERVVPPTSVLQQMRVRGRVTCIAFSSGNAIMAFGVTSGFEHVVQLRGALMAEMPIVGIFRGHTGHIHRVAFRKDSQLLLSCSSDKTVKVWRLDCFSSFSDMHSDAYVGCICTLPHGFPVYDGFFYQDHIVTCGYDPRIHVWRYDKDINGQQMELSSESTPCNVSQQLQAVGRTASESRRLSNLNTTGLVLGELVHVTSGDDAAIFHSVCGTELNHVWSVNALGNVMVWRIMQDSMKNGQRAWRMTIRHRFKCPGATGVEVCSTRALVTCLKMPVAYVFDDSECKLLHEISLHQRPYLPAITLLPDAEAIVAGTFDGKLLSWECSSGALCTPKSGYAQTQVNFAVSRLAWAGDQQLGVLLGTSGSAAHTVDGSLSHTTLVAIIGTPRTEESVILQSDLRAPDYFRARFGGVLTARRWGRGNLRDGSITFRVIADKKARSFAATHAQCEITSGDKRTRMDQIITLWKGLVGQHQHMKAEGTPTAAPPRITPNIAHVGSDTV